ncbi:hypothetical protein PJM26_30885, partial [Mycobacterium kansasii]
PQHYTTLIVSSLSGFSAYIAPYFSASHLKRPKMPQTWGSLLKSNAVQTQTTAMATRDIMTGLNASGPEPNR